MNIPGTMLGTGRYNWNSDTVWTSRANCLVRDMCTNMIIPLQCDQYWEKFIHLGKFWHDSEQMVQQDPVLR